MYRRLPSASKENLPIANDLSQKILCLPIYPDLEKDQIDKIVNIIATVKK